MKKITKIGIDALREEFPVITTQMMKIIMAGDGNKCVAEALFNVSNCGGWGLTYDYIENKIVDYISASKGITKAAAGIYLNEKGLTNNETHQVITMIYGGMGATCGSATTGACNIVAFNTGHKDTDGKLI